VRQQASKNVLMKDGKARRVPADRAQELIDSGKAKRYISNTIYRAMKLGIDIKDFNNRDEDGRLRARIRDLRDQNESKRKKAEKAKKRAEKELAKIESEDAED